MRHALWIRAANVVLAGLLAGTFVTAVVVETVSIGKLPATLWVQTHQILNRGYSTWAPGLIVATLVSSIAAVVAERDARSRRGRFTIAGAVLCVSGLVSTVVVNVPVNNWVDNSSLAGISDDWTSMRDRWDLGNDYRTLAFTLAFLLILAAAGSAIRNNTASS